MLHTYVPSMSRLRKYFEVGAVKFALTLSVVSVARTAKGLNKNQMRLYTYHGTI